MVIAKGDTSSPNHSQTKGDLAEFRDPFSLHKILHHNVAGLKNKSLFPGFWSLSENSDIFSFVETWCTSSFELPGSFSDHQIIESFATRGECGRPSGGIILGYHTKLVNNVRVLQNNRCFIIMSANYCNLKDVLIAACYFPPNSNFDTEMQIFFTLLLTYENSNIIVLGDFNARVGNLGSTLENSFQNDFLLSSPYTRHLKDGISNARGKSLFQICLDSDLVYLNGLLPGDSEGNFTFVSSRGASIVDYIIVSKTILDSYICDFSVNPVLGSDHLPLTTNLVFENVISNRQSSNNSSQSKARRALWRPELVDKFNSDIIEKFRSDENNPEDVIAKFTEVVEQNGLICNIFTNNNSKFIPKNSWYDSECYKLKSNLQKALKKVMNNYSDNIENYKNIRNEYKKLCKLKKCNYFSKIQSEIFNSRDSQTFWNVIRKFKRKKPIMSSKVPNHVWLDHFSKLFTGKQLNLNVNHINQLTLIGLPNDFDPILDSDITAPEVEEVLKTLKNNKSPGHDNLKPEYFKYLNRTAIQFLSEVFNKVLQSECYPEKWIEILIHPIFKKGDPSNPGNYRPISLIPVIGKIFTSILNKRLNVWLKLKDSLYEEQAGFRKGYSCNDQAFVLNSLIQDKLRKKRGKLYAVFIDLKSAFDSINHSLMWSVLRKLSLSSKMINILKNMYAKAKAKVRTPMGATDSFDVDTGVLQGEILSPLLFNLFLNNLIDRLNDSNIPGVYISSSVFLHILLYADDAVILAESRIDLQKKLNLLEKFCFEFNLEVNINKTKVMIFRKGGKLSKWDKFFYQNSELDIVREYVYLGIPFSANGKFNIAKRYFTSKAIAAIGASWSIFTGTRTNSIKSWFKLFESLVQSVFTYGSPIWSANNIFDLEKCFCFFVKKLFTLSRNIPGYILRLELGQAPLAVTLVKLLLKYWIKLLKLPDDRYTKICYQKLFSNTTFTSNPEYNWALSVKNIFQNLGFNFIWASQNPDLASYYLPMMLQTCRDQCLQRDFSMMFNSTHFPHYKLLKNCPTPENYITSDSDINVKRIIFQLRLNQTKIFYKGQIFEIKYTDKCSFCNTEEFDSWKHIFNTCPIYSYYRNKFLRNTKNFPLILADRNANYHNILYFFISVFKLRRDIGENYN